MATMELLIDSGKRLFEVQVEFQKMFPNLKIECYSHKHEVGKGSLKEDMLDGQLLLSEINGSHSGHLNVRREMKVSELETAFVEVFGIAIQVFRKSQGIWIQTTASDSWTLSRQNSEAMEHDIVDEEIIDSMDQQDVE
jgi:hypothetical protein